MIKAIFFDIDGTLIRMDTHDIPSSTLTALHTLKEKGIRLFIASGRPPVHIPLLCKEFREFPWDGYVLLNGQYCADENMEVFSANPISKTSLESLIPYLQQADFYCSVFEKDFSYEIRFNEDTYAYMKELGKEQEMPPVLDPIRALTHDTYQICPHIPPERDEEFLSHAPGMKSARWTPRFADMIPADGGKPEGMKKMLARHGLAMEECMAFGDGGNDMSMLEAAAIGVAMGNAEDRVKACADYVTDRIENDGIMKALQHYSLV